MCAYCSMSFLGSFWTPEGCKREFYKNRKQAYDNILGIPQQHDGQ